MKAIHLNYDDLNEEAQEMIMEEAREIVRENNPDEKDEDVINELAEQEMYNFNFIFWVQEEI